MSEQTPENTFTLTLAGREILFNKTSPGQVTVMQRYIERIRAQMDGVDDAAMGELFTKINRVMLDVVDTRFAKEEDRDWVEQQMMQGKLEISELLEVLRNGAPHTPRPADDDTPPTPAKRPGRKTPAAKKAAAKKAATSRRAKQ